MTLRALKLEVFEERQPRGAFAAAPVDTEEIRLAAYDNGYQSGWEDATAEREKSDHLITADLERNLRDISFSYAEARNEVLSGLKGLFDSILTGFLPSIAAEAVAPLVIGELETILNELGEARCEVLASPQTAAQLGWLAERYLESDLHIITEPAFADGRVSLRFGGEQREIDLSGMVQSMSTAIRDFTQNDVMNKEMQHA